jgi:hypothetical protein
MTRFTTMIGTVAVLAASTLVVGPALAQRGPGAGPHPLQPNGPGIARLARAPGVIEGKLTRVDGRSASVDVSIGLFGLLGKTLEVDRDTRIEVNGHEAQFADLQEGAKVKAHYQERGAKLVAIRIEVSTGA